MQHRVIVVVLTLLVLGLLAQTYWLSSRISAVETSTKTLAGNWEWLDKHFGDAVVRVIGEVVAKSQAAQTQTAPQK